MGFLNAVFVFHALPGIIGGIALLTSRGKIVLPSPTAATTAVTDALGTAVTAIGLVGLLVAGQDNSPSKRSVAITLALYHASVVAASAARVSKAEVTPVEPPAEAGKIKIPSAIVAAKSSIVSSGIALAWFLAYLKFEPLATEEVVSTRADQARRRGGEAVSSVKRVFAAAKKKLPFAHIVELRAAPRLALARPAASQAAC